MSLPLELNDEREVQILHAACQYYLRTCTSDNCPYRDAARRLLQSNLVDPIEGIDLLMAVEQLMLVHAKELERLGGNSVVIDAAIDLADGARMARFGDPQTDDPRLNRSGLRRLPPPE